MHATWGLCRWYELEVSYFKSALDQRLLEKLWNRYWVSTLSASPLVTNVEYVRGAIGDLANKAEEADMELRRESRIAGGYVAPRKGGKEKKLGRVAQDASKLALAEMNGLVSQLLKDALFNGSV